MKPHEPQAILLDMAKIRGAQSCSMCKHVLKLVKPCAIIIRVLKLYRFYLVESDDAETDAESERIDGVGTEARAETDSESVKTHLDSMKSQMLFGATNTLRAESKVLRSSIRKVSVSGPHNRFSLPFKLIAVASSPQVNKIVSTHCTRQNGRRPPP